MNSYELKNRCAKFLAAFKTPTTKFCRMIDLSCSAYYQWQRDELELSTTTMTRIGNFLSKYNF